MLVNKSFDIYPNSYKFLFSISIASVFLTYYLSNSLFRIVSILFGCLCFWYCIKRGSRAASTALFAIVSPLLLFSLLNIINTSGISAVAFFVLIFQFAIAWYFVWNARGSSLVSFVYVIFLLFTIYNIVLNDYGPLEFDSFFSGIGRNGYSALLFSFLVGYCVERVLNEKPVSIILVALGFFVMIPLYGRSSIIAAGIVLFGSILKGAGRFSYFYLIIFIVVIFWGGDQISNYSNILDATNFRSGTDSERWDVFNEWVVSLDVANILIGTDLTKLSTVVALDGNPHNSFIRLHSFFGISLIVLIALLLMSMALMTYDKQFFLICIFLAIVFKCFFDIIYFIGDQDFLLYPVLFYVFFRSHFLKKFEFDARPKSVKNENFDHYCIIQ